MIPSFNQRPKTLRLRVSVLWALLGNAALRGGQWVILLAVAWLGSPTAVGDYGLVSAISSPLAVLLGLQLGLTLSADRTKETPFVVYWRVRLFGACASCLLTVGVVALLSQSASMIWLALAFSLARIFEQLAELMHGRLRRADRLDLLSQLQMVRAATLAICFILTYALSSSLIASLIALSVASCACVALIEAPVSRGVDRHDACQDESHVSSRIMLALVAKSLPLGLSALVISLFGYMPLFFVEAFSGRDTLGVLVAVLSLTVVADTVVRSGLQATIPRLAECFAQGDEASFWRVHWKAVAAVTVFAAVSCAVTAIVGDQLVLLVFPADFGHYPGLLSWLMVATSLGYLANATPSLIAAGCYRLYLLLWLTGLLTLVVALAALVPAGGAYGSAYAIAIANLVRCLATYLLIGPRISKAFAAKREVTAQSPLRHAA